jgi:hypothetical protein
MSAPFENIWRTLLETDESKGYIDSSIKSIAPLFIGAGLGAFVPFLSPLIIAVLTSYILPKALRVAGNKIEIADA